MKKLVILAFLSIILALLLSSCSSGAQPTGLYISSLSYPTGNNPDHVLSQDEQYIPYTLDLANDSDQEIFVTSIEPVLSEVISARVKASDLIVMVKKAISSKGYVEVIGGVYFDAKGLSKNDRAGSLITGMKVTTEKIIPLHSK